MEFENLPAEMQMKIFIRLDIESKKSARLVCRNWTTAVNTLVRFNALLTNETMRAVTDSQVQIDKIRVSGLKKGLKASSERSQSLTEIKKLKIEGTHPLTSQPRTTVDNVRKLLVTCSKLEHLSFKPWSLEHVRAQRLFQGIQFLFLRKVKIVFRGKYNKNQHKAIKSFTTEGPVFPSLSHVIFDLYFQDCLMHKYHILYESMFKFVGRHSKTLKKLFIRHPQSLPSTVWIPIGDVKDGNDQMSIKGMPFDQFVH